MPWSHRVERADLLHVAGERVRGVADLRAGIEAVACCLGETVKPRWGRREQTRWSTGPSRSRAGIVTRRTGTKERSRVHNRMPIILGPETWDQWLYPKEQKPAALVPFLRPCPSDWLTSYPVGTRVNNLRNAGRECVRPLL